MGNGQVIDGIEGLERLIKSVEGRILSKLEKQSLNFSMSNYGRLSDGKAQTIRHIHKPIHVGWCDIKECGELKFRAMIIKVELVYFQALSKAHANLDGFSTVADLRAELNACYGRKISPFEQMQVITFELEWD